MVPARTEASLVTDHLEEEVCSEGWKHWKQGQEGTSSEHGIGRGHFGYPIPSALSTHEKRLKPTGAIVWETFPVWGPGVGVVPWQKC